MIAIDLPASFLKSARRLNEEERRDLEERLGELGEVFGQPHRHAGLGIRKLVPRGYEFRVGRQWRVVFLHRNDVLEMIEVLNHDEVQRWIKRNR